MSQWNIWHRGTMMLLLSLLIVCSLVGKSVALNDNCTINLDINGAEYTPLIVQNGDFLYPQKINENGHRIIEIVHGSQVEFVCHGSEEIPSLIRDGQPSLLLTCDDRRFLTPEAQGTYVYTLKCSEPQVPKILRSPRSACAAQGADDREDALEHLALIQIGWE
eukprot:maker-scaffold176_size284796-snap-gene-0.13 protein:Tk06848 transcript:maker-scaffold176_size284796-snap-gene-0.13-mRNA-1 annotation:"fibrinogen gamma isoform cra_b"